MAKAQRSKRIVMGNNEQLKLVNPVSKKLIREYKKDMSLRELSPATIDNYIYDLNQWLIYILENQDNRSVLELDEDDLTDFFYFCKSGGNNTRRMRRRYSSISAFYKFLRKKRKIAENPMEFVDRPIRDTDVVVQTYLTKEQIRDMKYKLSKYGDLTLEVYALLSLSTMARVNAISNIKWKQIDYGHRVIVDVLEKEGKYVTLYFSRECRDKLLKLQQLREVSDVDDGGYVFFGHNHKGEPQAIKNSTLAKWTTKIGTMIGVPTLHPHDFRHSGAQQLKLAGMALENISSLLNHASTEVTRKHYLKEDTSAIQADKDRYENYDEIDEP